MKQKRAKNRKPLSTASKVLLSVGAIGSVGAAIAYAVISTKAKARVKQLEETPIPKPKKRPSASPTQTHSQTFEIIQTQGPNPTTSTTTTTRQENQVESIPTEQHTTPTTTATPTADVNYENIVLYDYPLDEHTGPYTFTVNYHGSPLTVKFEGAPRYGLAKGIQREENAKYIGKIMDVANGKYKPTANEVLQLAYLIFRERSGLGRLSGEIELQRERVAMLWCVLNRILKTGRSISRTLSSSDMVSYYRDFDNPSKMKAALDGENYNYQALVRAFFDGYFFNEVPQQTNWSHPVTLQRSGARWSTWHLPSGTKDASGNIIGNTSRTVPTAMEDCVFPRALEL